MNPNDQQGGNPFASILAQLQGGQGQQQPQQAPQQAPAPMAPVKGSSQMQTAQDYQDPSQEQMMPGKTGDNLKGLVQAVTGLQSYVQNSTDPQMIKMLRQIITVITQLMAQEQTELANGIPESEEDGQEGGQSALSQVQSMTGGMGGGMQ
jgi:hypothetical protein